MKALSFLLLAAVICQLGCSSEVGPVTETVSGTVTLDGAPLEKGQIRFSPLDGLSSGGAGIIENGKYSFKTPHANMKVEIMSFQEIPGKMIEPNPGEKIPATRQIIPAKYNEKTELTADVKTDQTEFNFELTGK